MNKCHNRRETLWMDLYGELDAQTRSKWERHLENCGSCREERKRITRMMELIKNDAAQPSPHPHDVSRFIQSPAFKKALREGRMPDAYAGQPRPWGGFQLPLRFSPSLIALGVCLLLVIAGTIGFYRFAPFGHPLYSEKSRAMTEAIKEEEAEVIQHLDLLQEMDAIQKLVQRIDKSDGKSLPTDSTTNRETTGANDGAIV